MKHVAPSSEELEPVRLVAGGGTTHERRLLEAASLDIMPPGTPERLEQALSAWAASPAGSRGQPALAPRGGWAIRWGVMGGLGGLALVGWLLTRGSGEVAPKAAPPSGAVPIAAGPAAVAPAALAPAVLGPSLLPAPPPTARVEPELEARRTRAASQPKPRSLVSKTVAKRNARTERAGPRGNLLEEARRLDTVRAAVEAGNGSAARRELTEYRSRFPRGELALEADVLEADLLLLAGQPERARTLANALLSRPDSGRYRQRLEQLLQRAHASELRGGSNPARANMVESR